MCVVLETWDEKIITLPKVIVIGSRSAGLRMALTMATAKAIWDKAAMKFRIEIQDGDLDIFSVDDIKEKPNKEPSEKKVVSVKETSRTEVAGDVIVVIEFVYDDGSSESRSYVLRNGRLWDHDDTVWYSAPADFSQNWVSEPLGLPASVMTPPPSRGIDEGPQHEV